MHLFDKNGQKCSERVAVLKGASYPLGMGRGDLFGLQAFLVIKILYPAEKQGGLGETNNVNVGGHAWECGEEDTFGEGETKEV